MTARPIVIDNFLPDAHAVREHALASTFIDWPAPDGEVYRRVCLTDVPGLRAALELAIGPVDLLGMGYRLNFAGELPNAAIHSDLGWGTHALVLYLCDPPADGNADQCGTAFWSHRATGAYRIDPGDQDLLEQVQGDWNDESAWVQRQRVPLQFNRAVIYESALFHSRYPFSAFGEGPEDGRLIGVAFFSMAGAP